MKHYIRPMSDLHNEFEVFNIPKLNTDKQTVLILAGDIQNKGRSVLPFAFEPNTKSSYMEKLSAQFLAVIVVPGNHCWWGMSLDRMIPKMKQFVSESGWENVHILNNESVEIDGIKYIGSCFWTDFNNNDPSARITDQGENNNYKFIKKGMGQRINTQTILLKHLESKRYIEKELTYTNENEAILIFHHSPLKESWIEAHGDAEPEYSDFSDLGDWIKKFNNVTHIIHGHIHRSLDYRFNNKRVICNPRGYAPYHLNNNFNPDLTIPVGMKLKKSETRSA